MNDLMRGKTGNFSLGAPMLLAIAAGQTIQ
jgi:hypothetical protein